MADDAATPEAIAAVEEQDLDISNHRSRRIDAPSVAGADLLLGMAREHIREAVQLDPGALSRAFTLKELVGRAESEPRGERQLGEWLAALAAERPLTDLLGSSVRDDVEDPIGQPLRVYRKTVVELDDLAQRLVRAAWPGPA